MLSLSSFFFSVCTFFFVHLSLLPEASCSQLRRSPPSAPALVGSICTPAFVGSVSASALIGVFALTRVGVRWLSLFSSALSARWLRVCSSARWRLCSGAHCLRLCSGAHWRLHSGSRWFRLCSGACWVQEEEESLVNSKVRLLLLRKLFFSLARYSLCSGAHWLLLFSGACWCLCSGARWLRLCFGFVGSISCPTLSPLIGSVSALTLVAPALLLVPRPFSKPTIPSLSNQRLLDTT